MVPNFLQYYGVDETCSLWFLSYLNDLVPLSPQSDLLCMIKACPPIGLGVVGIQIVSMAFLPFCKLSAYDGRLGIDHVHTGPIEGYRIEGSEHPHIRDDGEVILPMTVAVGGDVDDHVDMERWPAVTHSLRILANLIGELVIGTAVSRLDRIGRADADAHAASHALGVVDQGCAIGYLWCVMGTDLGTRAAFDAQAFCNLGLAVAMHLHLASA